jgi:hypothetical protein
VDLAAWHIGATLLGYLRYLSALAGSVLGLLVTYRSITSLAAARDTAAPGTSALLCEVGTLLLLVQALTVVLQYWWLDRGARYNATVI